MNKKVVTLIIVVAVIIIISFRSFSQSYLELETSIDNERIQYIYEIEKQLVSRSNEIRNDITIKLDFASFIFDKNNPKSFLEAAKQYEDFDNINLSNFVLVSELGKCYFLDGELFKLSDKEILKKIIIDRKNISQFSTLLNGDSCLITSKAIEPFYIDDIKIVATMFIVDEDFYRERMTLPLFSNIGMSFVSSKNGKILIHPKYDKYQILGYNLFSSLKEIGVDDNLINSIKNDFNNRINNYKYFTTDQRWLIQYASFNDGNEFIISLIPVSIVSNQLINSVATTIRMGYITLFLVLILILILVVVIFNIISEKEKTNFESEIREKEALNRSDFLSQMSHDMRTPLSAIVGMSNYAKENIKNETTLIDSIDKINSSANYILEIINDILDLNKLESGKLELDVKPFSIKKLIKKVEDINQPKAKEKELFFKVIRNFDKDIYYYGDQLRITQILMNLISNAIKFTPENGSVTLYINKYEISKKIDNLIFIVEDSGIGMNKNFLDKLFIPYVQETTSISSTYGGSGLGLSIVDNLVKLMNGQIDVQSEKGKGSKFIISLKLQKTKNINIDNLNNNNKIDLSSLHVLFIEDHPINRLVGEKQLLSLGINNIVSHDNGKSGLEAYLNSEENYFSLILTDIRMPILDGYQLIENIRKSNRIDNNIPIIVMSANSNDEKINEAYKINATLCKPVNINELRQTICKLID